MPVEGPYKNTNGSPLFYFIGAAGCAVLLLMSAMCLTKEPQTRPVFHIDPSPEPKRPDPQVSINAENIQALAKRIERPTVYRYLDSRPVKLRASRFADPGDKWTGASSACKLPEDYRRVLPTDFVYAHRDWPCHQLAEICYRGLCVRAIKGTSGPFGCILSPGAEPFDGCQDRGEYTWCVTTKPRPDCEYRGQIDLGAAVADAIGVEGLKTVRVRRIVE
jgi:hypothetical protein